MPPDVLWIIESNAGENIIDPRALENSIIASQRMRVATPAAFLAKTGLTQAATSLRSKDDLVKVIRSAPKAVIFSKILGAADSALHFDLHEQLLGSFLERGTRVIVDVCDNYFISPAGQHLKRMISKATAVIANSAATADLIQENTNAQAKIIGDPVETRWGKPDFPLKNRNLIGMLRRKQPRPLNVLWYGGPLRSFGSLHAVLPGLARLSREHPLALHLVSAPFPDILQSVNEINMTGSQHFRATFSTWTLQDLHAAILESDLILLPGDSRDPARTGASANRLVDAIWAGRYVVASGIPSYWEFRHAASIGDDIISSLCWVLEHPGQIRRRIEIGQSIIQKRYTPEAIGHAWLSVLAAPE